MGKFTPEKVEITLRMQAKAEEKLFLDSFWGRAELTHFGM